MADRVIDLDAAKIARAEKQKHKLLVRFNGKDWNLPTELPWVVAEAAASGDGAGAMRAIQLLLGDQWEEFKEAQPSLGDMTVLLTAVGEMYGGDIPK